MFADTLFASTLRALAVAATVAAPALATPAMANDAALGEGIPVTVDLSEVEARPGRLYISIQTESEYMGIRGAGGVIELVTPGMSAATYGIDRPGTYAVSLWHDLDDDGVFSMDESYSVLDG